MQSLSLDLLSFSQPSFSCVRRRAPWGMTTWFAKDQIPQTSGQLRNAFSALNAFPHWSCRFIVGVIGATLMIVQAWFETAWNPMSTAGDVWIFTQRNISLAKPSGLPTEQVVALIAGLTSWLKVTQHPQTLAPKLKGRIRKKGFNVNTKCHWDPEIEIRQESCH